MSTMSDKKLNKGESTGGSFIGGFFLVMAILYFMWFFSGGPQKADSDKAFVEGPTYKNPYNTTKYGTVPSIDKVHRTAGELAPQR